MNLLHGCAPLFLCEIAKGNGGRYITTDFHYFDSVRAEYSPTDIIYQKVYNFSGMMRKKPGSAFYVMTKLLVPNIPNF